MLNIKQTSVLTYFLILSIVSNKLTLVQVEASREVSSTQTNNNDDDYYYDDEERTTTTSANTKPSTQPPIIEFYKNSQNKDTDLTNVIRTSISSTKKRVEQTTSQEEYYSDESSTETTTSSNQSEDDYYYDEDYQSDQDTQDEHKSKSDSDESHKSDEPYKCPFQCKCTFIKLNDSSHERDDEYYDYENEKQSTESHKPKSQQTDEYYDVKYDITVDCSGQELNSISTLFDYDFPLEQITHFNLSHNNFKRLKLDDGFEDFLNLRSIDFSHNPHLKSISARHFLKKFRHLKQIYLNGLINCKFINCMWYRTLIYLLKRNVVIEANNCDLKRLVNNVALISRCSSSLKETQGSDMPSKKMDNNFKFISASPTRNKIQTAKQIILEPDLSQIIIEGDTIELTCKYKYTMLNHSSLKWFMNDKHLTMSSIYHAESNDMPTQVKFMDKKNKLNAMIESKLIIKNAHMANSGVYSCRSSNESVSSNQVSIKVINKLDLNQQKPSTSLKNIILNEQDLVYCPQMITKTFKGVYKWPKTMSNRTVKLECVINPSNHSRFDCLPGGKWSSNIDLTECQFESNLTRYLTEISTNEQNKRIDLDQFINNIVSNQINENDVSLIQKLILQNSDKPEIRQQFIWLNDVLIKLNDFHLNRAQLNDAQTFSAYFFDHVLKNLIRMNHFSNYYATISSQTHQFQTPASSAWSISTLMTNLNSNQSNESGLTYQTCYFNEHKLSERIYFECKPSGRQSRSLQTQLSFQLVHSNASNSFSLTLFKNEKLFPANFSSLSSNESNYNFNYVSIKYTTCSQILLVETLSDPSNNPNRIQLNDSLIEINMPEIYFKLMNEIDTKLNEWNKNQTVVTTFKQTNLTSNLTKITTNSELVWFEREQNLFDTVFQNAAQTNANLSETEIYMNDYDKLFEFRNELASKWLNSRAYEFVLGKENRFNQSDSRLLRFINWTSLDQSLIDNCVLLNLTWNTTTFRLFAKFNCSVTLNEQYKFLALKTSPSDADLAMVNNSLISMIDSYLRVMRPKQFSFEFISNNYQVFTFKIIYFASIASCLLLIVPICVYIFMYNRLLMPRKFIHIYINIWSCVLLLNLISTLGINQVKLAHFCLFTAISTHYLMLCVFVWHSLYFYCLYKKLKTIKTRNYNLIFNEANKKEKEAVAEAATLHGNELVKPIIHLYMIAYGFPMLLCSIIISITKNDYIQVPFSFCFTNQLSIFIGSMAIPMLLMVLFMFVLIIVVYLTLRKIVDDLAKDKEDSDGKESEEKNNEAKREELSDEDEKKKSDHLLLENDCEEHDDVNSEQMIELKMDPVTQKSTIISIHKSYLSSASYCSSLGDNSTSDRTSVMDTQHKPNIQIKFFVLGLILLILAWTCGALILIAHSIWPDASYETEFLLNKLFSYLFALFLFVYSLIQLVFYVLSRGDVLMFSCSLQLGDNTSRRLENLCESSEADENYKIKNWYFQPRDDKLSSTNDEIQTTSSESDNDVKEKQGDQVDNREKIYERQLSNVTTRMPSQSQLQQNNETLLKRKESDMELVNPDDTASNNLTNEIDLVADEGNEDINLIEEQHKESICDMIFSAKKSVYRPSPSTQSSKSSSSSAHLSSSPNESSHVHQKLKLEEDSINLTRLPHCTLAVQEDVSVTPFNEKFISNGYDQKTSQHFHHTQSVHSAYIGNQVVIEALDENIYEKKRTNKTSRSKSKNKSAYVFVDYSYEENSMKEIKNYAIEPEKESKYTMNESASFNDKDSLIETSQKKSKTLDVLTNSCSANTGTALNSIATLLVPDLLKSSLSFANKQHSNSSSKSIGYASANGAGSSTISSSNFSSSESTVMNQQSTKPPATNNHISITNSDVLIDDSSHYKSYCDDRLKYQQYLHNVSSNSNRSSRSHLYGTVNKTSTSSSSLKQPYHQMPIPANRTSISVLSSSSSTNREQNTLVLNSSLLRNNLLRAQTKDIKHETSV
jgi:hypothetical protein